MPSIYPCSIPRLSLLPLLGLAAGLVGPVPAASAEDRREAADPFPEEIHVTAPLSRSLETSLSGSSILTGDALAEQVRQTIGETLGRQPGVSASSFGPNASRPVLRGFQGDRIRILTDGIGSFDVSNTSVDHPVAINPLTAERIEVLRGPAALLFGSSAIGGVVNVIDSRIPRQFPHEPVHGALVATYGSAANERSLTGMIDIPLGKTLVAHVDGSHGKSDDLDTGTYILSRPLRLQAETSADEEVSGLAKLRGKLPNSAARSWELSGGMAWVSGEDNVGMSITRQDSLIGNPVRYALDPSTEAEKVRLDIRQWREDVRAEIGTGDGLIERIKLRGGHADYRHRELEETGEVGTTFSSEAYEGRLELVQARRGAWRGAVGGQMYARELEIVGEEKFLPRNKSRQYGLFSLQELTFGEIIAEGGLRYEHASIKADADTQMGTAAVKRSFDAVSASIGATMPVAAGWRAGLNLSRSERAPTAEELFANGPHAGTQAFELGNPDFTRERNWGVEATLRGKGNGYNLSLAAFYNRFSGYIYEARVEQSVCEAVAAGREVELPCFQRAQADARHYGFEVEADLLIGRLGNFTIMADALADYVHATIRGYGPAPYIPPLRLLGGIEAQSARLDVRLETERVTRQGRVAAIEAETGGYTMVNAAVVWRPFVREVHNSILLSANNIFDVAARRHASVLRDFAPLAGRDIRLTLRLAL